MTDPILLKQLKRDEGLELEAYPDPVSALAQACKRVRLPMRRYHGVLPWVDELSGAPWTIGYGHTGPEVTPGLVWTLEKCVAVLAADIASHNATLSRVLPWVDKLDAPRRRVLQNMHFNMGWDNPRTPKLEGLAGFVRTLAAIERGDYEDAANRMKQSLWFTQTGKRAKRLVATMRDGVDR